MFSSSFASPFGRPGGMANVYRQVGVATSVESATPHKLVQMLFDGYMDAVMQARGAMRNKQVEAKGKAITRAVRIIDEGLKACLNLREGGPLAHDLSALYAYVTTRLTQANIRNDESILEECVSLVEPLRQAWREIGDKVAAPQQ